jgi:hypothetical protein
MALEISQICATNYPLSFWEHLSIQLWISGETTYPMGTFSVRIWLVMIWACSYCLVME